MNTSITPPIINIIHVLRGRCPRCGNGSVFAGVLRSVDACAQCGLNLKQQDAGDGPAFFAITIVGFIVTLLAALVELQFSPPYWVHIALWLPLILLLSILVLRVVKAYLIHLEYRLALLKDDHV
jgi:uncharacterized protein (DUF983 family)